MDLNNQQERVRDELVRCARARSTIFYGEAGDLIGIHARQVGKEVLDPINEAEYEEGRPLLTALVVRRGIGFPSSGFFDSASRLGLFTTSGGNEYLDRIAFLYSEVQRVFDAHHQTD